MKYTYLFSALLYTGVMFANQNCICYETRYSALFLQPNTSNLYYGAEANPLPIPSPNWKSLEISPNYHLGFELGISAQFKAINTKLNLDWERLHSSDSASRSVPETDMVGPYFNIGPDAQPYKNAYRYATHHFDEVNLNFKRPLSCENNFAVNYFGGLVFTRIKQSIKSYFSNNAATITREIKSPSLFTGGGVNFGMDFIYSPFCSFSMIGKTSLSLLSGQQKNNTIYLSNSPLLAGLGITPPNTQQTTVPNRSQIVPVIFGKIKKKFATT